MGKITEIGPQDHAPCVDSTPPGRITPEDIPYEEVISENVPPRKKVPKKLPQKEIESDKPSSKKKFQDKKDKSDDYTPPVQL